MEKRLVTVREGKLADDVAPNSLAVYTTAYSEEAPAAVQGFEIVPPLANARGGREAAHLRWEPSTEKDFYYYQIYPTSSPTDGSLANSYRRPPTHNERVGSSTKPEFVDNGPTRGYQVSTLWWP